MATTLATEKQAKAIKHRMAEIRSELPYRADVARHRVKQLTDWKYHMSRHPLPVLGTAILVGYLLVPAKRLPRPSSPKSMVFERQSYPTSAPASKGVVSGIAGAIATIAMRQAAAIAVSKMNSLISKRDSTL